MGPFYRSKTGIYTIVAITVLFLILVRFATFYDPFLRDYPRYSVPEEERTLENPDVISNRTCQFQKRIAFIKVHKAASTTITSVLLRFGLAHGLTFALPKVNHYHIGLFVTFKPENVLPIRKGAEYEVLCQHVVYNREAFRKYLPADIKVIAAVREPFARFVSAFQFFQEYPNAVRKKSGKYGSNSVDLMTQFLQKPDFYEPERFRLGSLAYNRLSFDLGVPQHKFNNISYVKDYIKLLDEDMSLVLIAEFFDQSLVLLKRRMCWTLKDILYQVRHKGPGKPSLPLSLKSLHRKQAPSEYLIYEFFKTKFLQMSEKEVDITEEVSLFTRLLHQVTSHCRSRSQTPLNIPRNKFDPGFTIDARDCHYLTLSEPNFVAYLKKLQKPSFQ